MGEIERWQRRIEEFVLANIGDPPARVTRVLEMGCGKGGVGLSHSTVPATA